MIYLLCLGRESNDILSNRINRNQDYQFASLSYQEPKSRSIMSWTAGQPTLLSTARENSAIGQHLSSPTLLHTAR